MMSTKGATPTELALDLPWSPEHPRPAPTLPPLGKATITEPCLAPAPTKGGTPNPGG